MQNVGMFYEFYHNFFYIMACILFWHPSGWGRVCQDRYQFFTFSAWLFQGSGGQLFSPAYINETLNSFAFLIHDQVEHIIRSPVGPVSSEAALVNLEVTGGDDSCSQPGPSSSQAATQQPQHGISKPLSKKDRISTLHQFVEDGWLAKSPDTEDSFCLGVST